MPTRAQTKREYHEKLERIILYLTEVRSDLTLKDQEWWEAVQDAIRLIEERL